jgi:hypothetical protein
MEHAADERKLADDPVVQAAAQRWIEVIGEAASHVSDELKLAHPDVAWREISGIRVILAHGYFPLIHPAHKNRTPRPGQRLLKPFRQIIESVNDSLKGQLDLERHGGRTPAGLATRILQRLLALTAAI